MTQKKPSSLTQPEYFDCGSKIALQGGRKGMMRMNKALSALDADENNTIDEAEIKGA